MPPLSAMTEWPPWAVMWALAVVVFAACKGLTWGFTPAPPAPIGKHLAYLFLWPGLDARAFLAPRPIPPEQRAEASEWAFAFAKLAFGVAVVWGVAPLVADECPYAKAWVGMVGVVFVLHFGFFHVLSCAWRSVGVDAKPLMNRPILSQSVSEFWGKRWNLAFRDITHRFLFRPLASRGRARLGLVAVFVFSGIVHDLVISLPAGGGCGLPTLYFVLQAVGLFAERSQFGKRMGLAVGIRGRLFTAAVVLGPAAGLFHPWFAREVVVPFLDAIGAG